MRADMGRDMVGVVVTVNKIDVALYAYEKGRYEADTEILKYRARLRDEVLNVRKVLDRLESKKDVAIEIGAIRAELAGLGR